MSEPEESNKLHTSPPEVASTGASVSLSIVYRLRASVWGFLEVLSSTFIPLPTLLLASCLARDPEKTYSPLEWR